VQRPWSSQLELMRCLAWQSLGSNSWLGVQYPLKHRNAQFMESSDCSAYSIASGNKYARTCRHAGLLQHKIISRRRVSKSSLAMNTCCMPWVQRYPLFNRRPEPPRMLCNPAFVHSTDGETRTLATPGVLSCNVS